MSAPLFTFTHLGLLLSEPFSRMNILCQDVPSLTYMQACVTFVLQTVHVVSTTVVLSVTIVMPVNGGRIWGIIYLDHGTTNYSQLD